MTWEPTDGDRRAALAAAAQTADPGADPSAVLAAADVFLEWLNPHRRRSNPPTAAPDGVPVLFLASDDAPAEVEFRPAAGRRSPRWRRLWRIMAA